MHLAKTRFKRLVGPRERARPAGEAGNEVENRTCRLRAGKALDFGYLIVS